MFVGGRLTDAACYAFLALALVAAVLLVVHLWLDGRSSMHMHEDGTVHRHHRGGRVHSHPTRWDRWEDWSVRIFGPVPEDRARERTGERLGGGA